MKRSSKILLGIATAWPMVYIFLFIAFILGIVAFSSGGPNKDLEPIFGGAFLLIFLIHFLTIFLTIGLTVFYIVHAVKNEALKSEHRAIWCVGFFFAGILAQPIYWYLNIWREQTMNVSPNYFQPPLANDWNNQPDFRPGAYVPPNEPPDWR